MSDPLLQVRALDVAYRVRGTDLPALRDVSFDVEPGEIVGLVGESGSGKSTVAAAVLGILARNGRITGGSIDFRGRELTALGSEQMRRVRGADIAMIFQDPVGSLNPTMTVGRQLEHVAASHPDRLHGEPSTVRKRIIDLFAEVGIPDPAQRFDDYPHQFSGGMRQRIMIAMALLLRPALIIADEATSALDVTLQAQILELFGQVRETRGTSILLVSHDLGVVAQRCDRVAVMYAGQVVEAATSRELFDAPRHPYTRALIATAPSYEDRERTLRGIPGRVPSLAEVPVGCAYAARCVHRTELCDAAPPPFVDVGATSVRCVIYAPGRTTPVDAWDASAPTPTPNGEATHQAPADAQVAGPPLLVARRLTKHFEVKRSILDLIRRTEQAAVRAVDGVDLELARGEILGLVGESGSGKTTLAMTLMRLTEATGGSVDFDGIDVLGLDRRGLRRLRSRVQVILQDPVGSLSPRMRIGDLLTEPYMINRKPVPDGRVAELLGLVGLSPELIGKYPYQLSGGQARRVSIARALALEPDLLVADEPTSGLDVSAAAGVLSLMKELRDRLGVSYLIITHDLNVVGQVADRIAVMYLGQVIETGTTAQIFEDPVHPYTQGLLAAVPRIHDVGQPAGDEVPRGEMPSPRHPPSGCRFHTRCELAVEACSVTVPGLDPIDGEHLAACHLWLEARHRRIARTATVAVAPSRTTR
jgi:peptide/nickel transport system ATP-binding protein